MKNENRNFPGKHIYTLFLFLSTKLLKNVYKKRSQVVKTYHSNIHFNKCRFYYKSYSKTKMKMKKMGV